MLSFASVLWETQQKIQFSFRWSLKNNDLTWALHGWVSRRTHGKAQRARTVGDPRAGRELNQCIFCTCACPELLMSTLSMTTFHFPFREHSWLTTRMLWALYLASVHTILFSKWSTVRPLGQAPVSMSL